MMRVEGWYKGLEYKSLILSNIFDAIPKSYRSYYHCKHESVHLYLAAHYACLKPKNPKRTAIATWLAMVISG